MKECWANLFKRKFHQITNLYPVVAWMTNMYLDYENFSPYQTEFSYDSQLLTEILFKAMAAPRKIINGRG